MMDDRFKLRCAVYVLFIKGNKFLLFRRVNTGWHDGLYGIPGGHLEKGETVLQAAIREAFEETGLTVDSKDLELAHIAHRKSHHDYIDLFFKAKKWTGKPRLTEENKSDKILWANIDNLPEKTSDYMKDAIESIRKGVVISQFGW